MVSYLYTKGPKLMKYMLHSACVEFPCIHNGNRSHKKSTTMQPSFLMLNTSSYTTEKEAKLHLHKHDQQQCTYTGTQERTQHSHNKLVTKTRADSTRLLLDQLSRSHLIIRKHHLVCHELVQTYKTVLYA